jgi:hypothetical protein
MQPRQIKANFASLQLSLLLAFACEYNSALVFRHIFWPHSLEAKVGSLRLDFHRNRQTGALLADRFRHLLIFSTAIHFS